MEKLYSLKQIQVAFWRHCRGGGELWFKDHWIEDKGCVEISWEGFRKELDKVPDNDDSS